MFWVLILQTAKLSGRNELQWIKVVYDKGDKHGIQKENIFFLDGETMIFHVYFFGFSLRKFNVDSFTDF